MKSISVLPMILKFPIISRYQRASSITDGISSIIFLLIKTPARKSSFQHCCRIYPFIPNLLFFMILVSETDFIFCWKHFLPTFGYNGGQWLAEGTETGFSDLNLGAVLLFKFKRFIISPFSRYTFVLLDGVSNGNHFWFGISLTFKS
jgi:hypothetical protein